VTCKTVCVVTGSRAEFGLLAPLLRALKLDPHFHLQLVATGTHLSQAYGYTLTEIQRQGYSIDAVVDTELGDDSPPGIASALGKGVMGFAQVLPRLNPDLLLLLGDRYEILAAAQTALILGLPVAHMCGGELTEGAFDDAIRHSISKMASWHFVAAEPYRQRVIQLGERPDKVFVVGAPGLDGIEEHVMERLEFEFSVGLKLRPTNFLITYHPETLSGVSPVEAFQRLLSALDDFPEASCIFTKPNADTGGLAIARAIDDYVSANPGRTVAHTSLGFPRYVSAIHYSTVVIGNSSSGLTEVPAMKRPTVNIGERQRGRLRARSVIDTQDDRQSIVSAIRQALSEEFVPYVQDPRSPYAGQGWARKILAVLRDDLPAVRKTFYDIPTREGVLH